MRIAIIIILVLGLAAPAHGAEWFTWDDDNTALHVPLTALMVVDLGQTLWIADNCYSDNIEIHTVNNKRHWHSKSKCHETNNKLGNYPSRGEVWTYFAGSYALTTFVTWALPEKYSHAFQGGVISLELYAVDNNLNMGIGWKF